MQEENEYMLKALETAYNQIGISSPNPAVGAVIVKNNRIISTGGTCSYGHDHAEVTALKNAGDCDLSAAEMYVTLEPCSHFGKTPPCTDAIIKSGIKRVYTPMLDPNPLVAGKGLDKLKIAGIDVVIMENMASYASDLLRPFKKFILEGKPYILNKSALTLDGRIATSSGDSKWISSAYSRYIVHKLRAKVDAVIVGKNTFLNDNPSLNVRLEDFDNIKKYFSDNRISMNGRDNFFLKSLLNLDIPDFKKPLRVVVGLPEKIDSKSNFFCDDRYVFFASEKQYLIAKESDENFRSFSKKLNIIITAGKTHADQIQSILEHLTQMGVMFAMVEGGGGIAGAFHDAGQIDQYLYFIAPKIAGQGISPVRGAGHEKMSDAAVLKDISVAMIGDDTVYNAYSRDF